jgi:hypothetical protein
MGDAPYRVSNTEMGVFRECRRKWWIQYYLKLKPRARAFSGPLPLGTRVHAAMESYYTGQEELLAAYRRLVHEERAAMLAHGDLNTAEFDDEAELGRIMLEGYLEWVATEGVDADLKVIGVEEVLEYPMLEDRVIVQAKLDLRVVKEFSGARSVLDFKHQPLSEPVLTPTGWRSIGDIQPGDSVIGSSWTPVEVVGTSSVTRQPVYRVEFTDGTYTLASEDHPWSVHFHRQDAAAQIVTTKRIAEFMSGKGRQHDVYITGISGAKGSSTSDPKSDAYLLGAWLANGSSGPHTSRITDGSGSEAIFSEAGLTSSVVPSNNYHLAATCPKAFTQYLRTASLLTVPSHERFVPTEAVMASFDYRKRLLHGLMDSDGSMTGSSSCVYLTSSERLADDVALLVRSLGGHSSVWKHESPRYTYNGEVKYGRDAYRVNIRTDFNPFLRNGLNRDKWDKIESKRKTSRQHLLKKVRAVTYISEQDCVCLMLDCNDHLYVTRGGVLTHNTSRNLSDFDKTSHMTTQLKLYMMLDKLINDNPDSRIDGGIYRLLKKVKRTARATPPFYRDVYVHHNDFTLRSFWFQLQGVLAAILGVKDALDAGGDPMVHAYPSPTRDCSWKCPAFHLCPMFDDGSDVEAALSDQFEVSDPYAYYHKEGDTPED